MAASPNVGRLLGGRHSHLKNGISNAGIYIWHSFVGYAHSIFSCMRIFVSLIFSNAEWIASSDLALLGSAYESTRIALQREASPS